MAELSSGNSAGGQQPLGTAPADTKTLPSSASSRSLDITADAATPVIATPPPPSLPRHNPSSNDTQAATAVNLSLDAVQPVDVHIRNIAVTVDTAPSWLEPTTYPALIRSGFRTTPTPKPLLRGVTATFAPGTLTAILGGSGSGKTTLLNTVAERVASPRLACAGTATFNARPGLHASRVRHAYVMQQDVLLPTLTVRETLQYAADLRLPAHVGAEARARVVDEVVLELGLKECANTQIGSGRHGGCSGGEKRRTSIGVQLLANPSVLFCDEPTTGLDASSAFQIVRSLKALAQKGRTVIITIHQPRSEIWDLFDNLVVLSRGSPVFSAPRRDCLPWFAAQGFALPPFVNPAEFVVDTVAIDTRSPELDAESSARVQRLKDAWKAHEAAAQNDKLVPIAADPEKAAPPADVEKQQERKQQERSHHHHHHHHHSLEQRAPFFRQLRVLTSRTFKVTVRDPLGMAAALLEAVLMAVITGYIFFDLARDLSGIRSRQGALYNATGLQGYLILIFETYRLTVDIQTFDREASEGCVGAVPFVVSRRLARALTEDIPVPLVFSLIYYFMTGLERDAPRFLVFFAISLLNQYIAVTCAMACVAAVRHFAGASLIANLVFTLQSMACGMFIQSNSIPVYVRWLKHITYAYYVFGGYCGNEFQGNFYACPADPPASPENPACRPYVGEQIMASLGFPPNWVARPIAVMAAFVVFFFVLSTAGLALFKVDMTIARARPADTSDLSAGKEKMTARSAATAAANDDDNVRTIDVRLDNFALALDRRSWLHRRLPRKTILAPVTATFQAGVLNVISGPSGSGKTSLLNAMAQRLHNGFHTRYRPTGQLTFNRAMPTAAVVRAVCSYVCQDDDALLPSLTVRETLQFAAGLRLPAHLSAAEKRRRANAILLKLGLRECADTLIGNELIKGISGGEKRRVSIAVQILTEPRVLLCDEPTSGLDAATAASIMDVLRGLAEEGRTVVVTIHQARSDLFRHFGNVLLLARGGNAVYAGPASRMLAHFERLGHPCPEHTNPADFVIDLITIDLQEQGREAQSRARVQKLVAAWQQDVQQQQGQCQEPGAAPLGAPAQLGALVRARAPLRTSFPLLLHRASINMRRQPQLLLARLLQVLGLAVVIALFFSPLGTDAAAVQNRMGLVQQIGAFYFVGILQNVAVYPAERSVFYREHDDGVYGATVFLAAYTVLEVPFEVVSCLLFGVLAVFAMGLPRRASTLFVAVFACFGTVSAGESLGIIFNTLAGERNTGFAVSIVNVVTSVAVTMSGVLSTDMPPFLKAVDYLSPVGYAVRALAPYTLRGVRFTCGEAERLPDGRCLVESGEDVLQLYNIRGDPVKNIAGLAGCIVVYRILAWALLKLVRTNWRSRPWKKQKG